MSKNENKAHIIQMILLVGGILGGIIGIGDRLYAKKETVAVMGVQLINIDKNVAKIWQVFEEYEKINARKNGGK